MNYRLPNPSSADYRANYDRIFSAKPCDVCGTKDNVGPADDLPDGLICEACRIDLQLSAHETLDDV